MQITVLALIVLAVLGVLGAQDQAQDRLPAGRAGGQPVHAAARYGQGRGADYLGQYAPQQTQQQGSGADDPGAYAPRQTQPAQQPSGADFLGAYAPQRQTGGPASSA